MDAKERIKKAEGEIRLEAFLEREGFEKVQTGWVRGIDSEVILLPEAEAKKRVLIMNKVTKGMGISYRAEIPTELFGLSYSLDKQARQWAIFRTVE